MPPPPFPIYLRTPYFPFFNSSPPSIILAPRRLKLIIQKSACPAEQNQKSVLAVLAAVWPCTALRMHRLFISLHTATFNKKGRKEKETSYIITVYRMLRFVLVQLLRTRGLVCIAVQMVGNCRVVLLPLF